ncbi:MAG TPA: cytochrome c oxidase assembly protein [Rhizobiaceae bacterium]|nr:cytochrome c oxidase assembly protein [Rhizobiaceae bacterium]
MKAVAATLGTVLLALLWGGPFLDAWRGSFAAHMSVHMGVVAFAAPLLAFGVSGTAWDPVTSRRWISPIPASLLELVVVWAWHAPVMRAMAQNSVAATVLEQAMFLVAGVLLWLACLGHSERDTSVRNAAGVIALLLTSMHMTLLGVLLALAPRPLYGTADVSCFGITLPAQGDQQLGGVIMLMIGAVAYLVGGLALAGRLLTVAPGAKGASR